jgi:hypothetical protein
MVVIVLILLYYSKEEMSEEVEKCLGLFIAPFSCSSNK